MVIYHTQCLDISNQIDLCTFLIVATFNWSVFHVGQHFTLHWCTSVRLLIAFAQNWFTAKKSSTYLAFPVNASLLNHHESLQSTTKSKQRIAMRGQSSKRTQSTSISTVSQPKLWKCLAKIELVFSKFSSTQRCSRCMKENANNQN